MVRFFLFSILFVFSRSNADTYHSDMGFNIDFSCPLECKKIDTNRGFKIIFNEENSVIVSSINDEVGLKEHIRYSRNKYTYKIKNKSSGSLGLEMKDFSKKMLDGNFIGTTFNYYYINENEKNIPVGMHSFMIFSPEGFPYGKFFISGSYSKDNKGNISRFLDTIKFSH